MKLRYLVAAIATVTALVGGQPSISTAATPGQTLDLRVLVISSGDRASDLGLGLMTPMLDQMLVPYDVLDARTQNLTADRLAAEAAGRYNGIILTEAVLYDPASPTGSAFTAAEWSTLHDYERTFGIRESVISGFPGTYPQFDLDYGMTDIVGGAPFTGRWVPPSGTEVFTYVNTNHTLAITDWAINSRPLRLYAGEPSTAAAAPAVQPLLVLDNDPEKAFVSILRYDDGREVLLSTITNAWYLIHSQVLAYEFLDFATKGLFIGGRFAHLSAQVDDLFIGDSQYDPATNTTNEDDVARMSGDDFRNAVASQNALRAHPTATDFTLEFPFNGMGAQLGQMAPMTLESIADTMLKQKDANKNFGTDPAAEVNLKAGEQERALLQFAVPAQGSAPLTSAALTLFNDDQRVPAAACPISQGWDEGIKKDNRDATWNFARTGVRWSTPGGDYDAAACINFVLASKTTTTIDVTPLVAKWVAGAQPNNGFIVVATGAGNAKVKTREEANEARRPSLRLDFGRFAQASGPVTVPPSSIGTTGDTYLRQNEPAKSFGADNDARVKRKADGTDEKRALLDFDLVPGRVPIVESAILDVFVDGDQMDAQVCPVIDRRWEEGTASWSAARTAVAWRAGPGGDYDASYCQSFTFAKSGHMQVDVTDIVEAWQAGDLANFGLVVVGRSVGETRIKTREEGDATRRPQLQLTFLTVTPDGLTAAVLADPVSFRYLTHTFTHRDMDVSAGTTYDEAMYDIDLNRRAWDALGLPNRTAYDPVLVSGEHSGLGDDNGTDTDITDDRSYPDARNAEFLQAAHDAGIQYLASDSSRPNQNIEGFVPGYEGSLTLLPRYPTAIFYNVTNPAQLTDEYNYVFHDRYVDAGEDPCTIPAAICTPRTYDQILAVEAEIAIRHILTYNAWPHFFHDANLIPYDGSGSTLLFDWLEATITRYESLFTLPLVNQPYYEIAADTADRLDAAAAHVRGVLDVDTGVVTLLADGNVRSLVTGLSIGQPYGGQRIAKVDVGPTAVSYNR